MERTNRVNSPASQIPEVDSMTEDSAEWVILNETDEEIDWNDSDNTRQGNSSNDILDDMENSPESTSAVDSKMTPDEACEDDSPTDLEPEKLSQIGTASARVNSNIKIRPNVKLDLPTLLEFPTPVTAESVPLTADPPDGDGFESEVTDERIPAMAKTPVNLLTLLVTLVTSINKVFQKVYQGMWAWFLQTFVNPFLIPPTSPDGKVEENKMEENGRDSKSPEDPDAPKPRSRKSKGKRESPKQSVPISLDNNSTNQKIPTNSIITSCHKNYGLLEIGAGSTIESISHNHGIISIGENSRVMEVDCNYGTICTGGNCTLVLVNCNYGTINTGSDDRVYVQWNYGCVYTGPGTLITIENRKYGMIMKEDGRGRIVTYNFPNGTKTFRIQMVNRKWEVETMDSRDPFNIFSSIFGLPPEASYSTSTSISRHIHHHFYQ